MKSDQIIQATLTSYRKLRQLLLSDPLQLSQVLNAFLHNIAQKKDLNDFVRVYEEEARAEVQALMHRGQENDLPPLAGMMVGLKDLFCYADHPVQAASRILEGFVSAITATVVSRLREAGAIILGHQNCDQFGMGSSNENSIYGAVRHPLDPQRSAGGSSGGSAAAVKAEKCHVSLGTDTGGSVRQPAALCGIIGLKPTSGVIPRFGLIAYSSSFDTVGILSHNVTDCALVLNQIAGKDPRDMTSRACVVDDYTALLNKKLAPLKIGYLQQTLNYAGLQPEIKTHTQDLLRRLAKAGHEVIAVDFPLLDHALPTYYILTTGEASTELARYDGVRYGLRAQGTHSFQEMVRKTRTLGFGREVKKRLMLGAFVTTSDYYDSYYGQAQRVRQKVKTAMEKMFDHYDYLICPTTPTTAFTLHNKAKDPIAQYMADLYTVPASVAGLPAITVPNGCDHQDLPIGVQIIAPPLQEQKLLQFAQYIVTINADKNSNSSPTPKQQFTNQC